MSKMMMIKDQVARDLVVVGGGLISRGKPKIPTRSDQVSVGCLSVRGIENVLDVADGRSSWPLRDFCLSDGLRISTLEFWPN